MFNNQDIDIIDGKTERLKVGETVHVIEYSAYEALKFPLSDASKQVYKRSFKSIDECQDFYCGYAIKIKEELESEREKLTKAVALIDSIKNNIGFGGRENMIAAMDKIVKFQTEILESKPESNSEGEA